VFVLLVAEGVGAADHAFGGNPVDLVGDRSHEVAVTARRDERREPVALQIAQQLDHRPVAALAVGAVERRMGPAQEVGGDRLVGLDRHPAERAQDAAHQNLHVAVVTVVVLGDHIPNHA
jgi:hypothetical protein